MGNVSPFHTPFLIFKPWWHLQNLPKCLGHHTSQFKCWRSINFFLNNCWRVLHFSLMYMYMEQMLNAYKWDFCRMWLIQHVSLVNSTLIEHLSEMWYLLNFINMTVFSFKLDDRGSDFVHRRSMIAEMYNCFSVWRFFCWIIQQGRKKKRNHHCSSFIVWKLLFSGFFFYD